MSSTKQVIIAGTGGIGKAVAILLAELSQTPPELILADRRIDIAEELAQHLKLGTTQSIKVSAQELDLDNPSDALLDVLHSADLLLDCLPGRFAPKLAGLARAYGLHYANLTEHVDETRQIEELAKGADTGFVLQTGLAPGFVNVLSNGLFQHFCRKYKVDKVLRLSMKVGALTPHATSPHYYGFTWSPSGVANEYLQPVQLLRDYKLINRPARSEREKLYLNGRPLEADLTSGGAADLPEAMQGKVKSLDYKTLRYPGHFDWVEEQLAEVREGEDPVTFLQERMEREIPLAVDDIVLVYAHVEGLDRKGKLQKLDRYYNLHPQPVGKHTLRAIQVATAAPMAEVASMLLKGKLKGVIRQSQLNPEQFLQGTFITAIYGKWNGGESKRANPKYQMR